MSFIQQFPVNDLNTGKILTLNEPTVTSAKMVLLENLGNDAITGVIIVDLGNDGDIAMAAELWDIINNFDKPVRFHTSALASIASWGDLQARYSTPNWAHGNSLAWAKVALGVPELMKKIMRR